MPLTQEQEAAIVAAMPQTITVDGETFSPIIEFWKFQHGRYTMTRPVIRLFTGQSGVVMNEYVGYKVTPTANGALCLARVQVDVMARDIIVGNKKVWGKLIAEALVQEIRNKIRNSWDGSIGNMVFHSIDGITDQSGMMAPGFIHRRIFDVILRYFEGSTPVTPGTDTLVDSVHMIGGIRQYDDFATDNRETNIEWTMPDIYVLANDMLIIKNTGS